MYCKLKNKINGEKQNAIFVGIHLEQIVSNVSILYLYNMKCILFLFRCCFIRTKTSDKYLL